MEYDAPTMIPDGIILGVLLEQGRCKVECFFIKDFVGYLSIVASAPSFL
jgi:hypothetical protein